MFLASQILVVKILGCRIDCGTINAGVLRWNVIEGEWVHMYCFDVFCATIVCPISNAVLRFLLAKIPFILFSFLYEKLVHKPLGNYIC